MAAWSSLPAPSATESGSARRSGDGAGAAGGGVLVVEEGVGHGVDELVRELRGHRRVDGEAADGAGCDAAQDLQQAVDVHRFGERVFHHLAHERVVGDFDVAGHGLGAGRGVREDAGEEIVGARALDLRSDALALLHAQQLEASGRRPSASGS